VARNVLGGQPHDDEEKDEMFLEEVHERDDVDGMKWDSGDATFVKWLKVVVCSNSHKNWGDVHIFHHEVVTKTRRMEIRLIAQYSNPSLVSLQLLHSHSHSLP